MERRTVESDRSRCKEGGRGRWRVDSGTGEMLIADEAQNGEGGCAVATAPPAHGHHTVRTHLKARDGQLLRRMAKQGIGQAQIALAVLKVDRVHLVWHGGGANFTSNDALLEVAVLQKVRGVVVWIVHSQAASARGYSGQHVEAEDPRRHRQPSLTEM